MSSFPDDLARQIANRLAGEMDPSLPERTERVLAEGTDAPPPPSRTFDPATTIALAALLVSAAQFAWGVYRDLKKDREAARSVPPATPPRELLQRRLRMEFRENTKISGGQRDRLFEVVVDEVLARESGD